MKAPCYRSLKKSNEPHLLAVILKEIEDNQAAVHRSHCSCEGGSGGHCNHKFALLFRLNDNSCLKIKDMPSDVICTRVVY